MFTRYLGGGIGHLEQFPPANNDHEVVYEYEDSGEDAGGRDGETGEDEGDKDGEEDGEDGDEGDAEDDEGDAEDDEDGAEGDEDGDKDGADEDGEEVEYDESLECGESSDEDMGNSY